MGIAQVTTRQEQVCRPNQPPEPKDVVDIEVATPQAKAFIDTLLDAPFFDPSSYAITVRQPRAIVARATPMEVTPPLIEPTV